MKKITLILILTMTSMYSQKKLPFYQIQEAPNEISSTNIMVRMVQGLGFRYHWATQDLTEKDLKYRPSKDAISNFETIKHIYNLSNTIYNSTKTSTNIRSEKKVPTDYRSLRRETLNNLKLTSEAFESFNDEELKNVKIIIQRKSHFFYCECPRTKSFAPEISLPFANHNGLSLQLTGYPANGISISRWSTELAGIYLTVKPALRRPDVLG